MIEVAPVSPATQEIARDLGALCWELGTKTKENKTELYVSYMSQYHTGAERQ